MLPVHFHRNVDPASLADQYANYPETLIMIVPDAYSNFIDTVADTEKVEVYVGEAIEEIVAHVSDQGMIECALDILRDHTNYNHLINGSPQDGRIISIAMTNLGKALYDTLNVLGAYDSKGALPYKYSHYSDDGSIYLIKDLTYV